MSQRVFIRQSQAKSVRPAFPRAFYLSLLATTLFAMGLTMLIPLMPLFITDELGAAEHWVGTGTLVVTLAAVSTRIPAGASSDRHGRRRIMLIGGVAGMVAALLYIMTQNLAMFMCARVMTGLSIALFTTTGKALAADLAPTVRRGEAMGLNNAAFSIASVISPIIGEGLKNEVSFRAVFVLSSLLMLGALVATYPLPRSAPQRNTPFNASGDVKDTLHQRGMWAAILTMLGMGTILAVMYTFYPLMATRKDFFADAPRLLSPVAIGLGLGVWSLMDTTIEPIAGRLSDRIGRQPVILPGLLITMLGVYMLSRAHNTPSAYFAIALLAGGWGMARAATDSVSQDALPPALRGMGAAVLYTCFDLAVGMSAQLLGGLVNGSDFSAFFAAALVSVLVSGSAGLLLASRLKTYEQRKSVPAAGD
jgi:DHA1 family multidrug resistance protein-like MFS transporter